MQSIRFRLAVYYSLALTATMVAFGAAVYLGTDGDRAARG